MPKLWKIPCHVFTAHIACAHIRMSVPQRLATYWWLDATHHAFTASFHPGSLTKNMHTHTSRPWTSALHRWLDATLLSPQKALRKVIILDRKKGNMTGRRQMRLIEREEKKGMKRRGKEGSKRSKQEGMKGIKAGWSFSCKLLSLSYPDALGHMIMVWGRTVKSHNWMRVIKIAWDEFQYVSGL